MTHSASNQLAHKAASSNVNQVDVENQLNGVTTAKNRAQTSGSGLSLSSGNAGPPSPDTSVKSSRSRTFRALGDRFRRQKA